MLLSDLRLKFARDLIGHWLDIRAGALVPLEADIDPRELLHCFDYTAIADLTQPAKVIFDLAGVGVGRRFGRDIRHVNWVDLVPETIGDAGIRARERIRSSPCGFYHKLTVALEGAPAVTTETLMLPLRHRRGAVPHAVIGMTREAGGGADGTPAGWLTPSVRVEHYFSELVDIGASISVDEWAEGIRYLVQLHRRVEAARNKRMNCALYTPSDWFGRRHDAPDQ